jgi:hypothetical protein
MKKRIMSLLFVLLFFIGLNSAGAVTVANTGVNAIPNDVTSSCSIADDKVTVTCPTLGSNTFFLSVDYTKSDETALIVTPKHNYNWDEATYRNLAVPDTLNSGVTSNIFYSLLTPNAFKFTATCSQTYPVYYPESATKIQFIISFTGSEAAGTVVRIGGRTSVRVK